MALVPTGPHTVILPGGVRAPASFADLVERAAPAVVFIRTSRAQRRGGKRDVDRALASGFLVNATGLILTNSHVVESASTILVTLFDGREFSAKHWAGDSPTDIALIQIEATGVPFLSLGDSDAVRVGDWVLAIGNPFGLSNTVSAGIVSARERSNKDVQGLAPDGFYDFIQTDASINPGNSGGPLLDLAGGVIGMNTAINVQANNIGYAIPSNRIREVLPGLMSNGRIQRSAIGISIASLGPLDVRRIGVPNLDGVLVTRVAPGGPGHLAGLLVDDVVVAFDSQPVKTLTQLRWLMSLAGVGRRVPIRIWRDGRQRELTVQLGAYEDYVTDP